MSSSAAPPGATQRTVKRTAAVGGLSLAALAAFVVPWATTMSHSVAEVKAEVGAVHAQIEGLPDEIERCNQAVSDLKAGRAASDAVANLLSQRLDRIESKLDRALERNDR